MKPRLKPPRPVRDLFEERASVIYFEQSRPQLPRANNSGWGKSLQCCSRLADLKALIMHRHGGRPCDTDDGAAYLAVAVSALLDQDDSYICSWARIWTPRLGDEEVSSVISNGRDRYERREPFPRAQEVGNQLALSVEEREALNIRTIRPAGWSARKFSSYQKARRAEKDQARWLAKKSTASPPSKMAVARELGISISAYKRDLAAGKRTHPTQAREPVSSLIEPKALSSGNGPAHEPIQTLADPAMMLGGASRSGGADGHAAGGKARAVRRGGAVALPLPDGEVWTQADLLEDRSRIGSVAQEFRTCLQAYAGGPMTSDQRTAMRDLLRHMGVTHGQFGNLIGVSRQQVTNTIRARGNDGFGWAAAANLRQLLAVAA